MLRLDTWKSLGKGIGDHVIRRTIEKTNGAILDRESDKMITNVDMFGSSMVIAILRKSDGGLIVGIKDCGMIERLEDLSNESTKPESFVCSIASAVERVTSSCLREPHKIAPPSTRKANPVIA